MPRLPRKITKAKIQHIMSQGIEKQYIFEKEEYIQKYKELIIKKKAECSVTILAYCIMNNHTHLLIYSENQDEISKFMQKLNTSYSMYYNKINNRVGYVFRNRFNSQEIFSQSQLYTCLRYIHNNPVKAGITKTMQEYKYSSYNEFFDQKTVIDEKSAEIIFGTIENKEEFRKNFEYIHYQDMLVYEKTELEKFAEEFEKKYKVKLDEINKNRGLLKLAIKEAKKITGAKNVEIARLLQVSESTISRCKI